MRILEAVENQWPFNRFLYEFIGAARSWEDKLTWTPEQWAAYVGNDNVHTYVAYYGGAVAGYYELKMDKGNVEIVYFGLAQQFIGKGLGGVMLTRAIEDGRSLGSERVWVHTCTLDHPAALENYKARGMSVYKTEVEDDRNE